jgi:hypothetical protein
MQPTIVLRKDHTSVSSLSFHGSSVSSIEENTLSKCVSSPSRLTNEERRAENPMVVYGCQGQVGGQKRLLELKYEIHTCKWYLYKI